MHQNRIYLDLAVEIIQHLLKECKGKINAYRISDTLNNIGVSFVRITLTFRHESAWRSSWAGDNYRITMDIIEKNVFSGPNNIIEIISAFKVEIFQISDPELYSKISNYLNNLTYDLGE